MKIKIKLYFLVFIATVAAIAVSCSNESSWRDTVKDRGYGQPPEIYKFDSAGSDDCIVRYLNTTNLKLVLIDSGRYYFSPQTPKLDSYEGTWDIKLAGETLGNIVFNAKNGQTFEAVYCFDIETDSGLCKMCFEE